MAVRSCILILTVLILVSCSAAGPQGSNKISWFNDLTGGETEETQEQSAPEDPRPLAQELRLVETNLLPTGIILTATGVPPSQGSWIPELVPLNGESALDGVLLYEFRISGTEDQEADGSPGRALVAARAISELRLEGVNSVTVRSATNSMSVDLEDQQ